MNFYISDLHIGHNNALTLDNRPFVNLEEMKMTIVNNWNSVVSNADHVYILGDMFWKNDEAPDILKQLNGNKHLILGNHDRINGSMRRLFVSCDDTIKVVKDGEDHVVLSHYPIACWQGQCYTPAWIHLYGHIHASRDERPYDEYGKMWSEKIGQPFLAANVGSMIDYMGYTPRTLEDIKKAKGWTE